MHKRKVKGFPPKSAVAAPQPIVEMSPDDIRLFDLEVCLCIEELEKKISSVAQKQKSEIESALRTLKDVKVPVIKKRQIMRQFCADYKRKAETVNVQTVAVNFESKESRDNSNLSRIFNKHSDNKDTSFKFNFPTPSKDNSDGDGMETETVAPIVIPLSDNSFRFNF